MNIFWILALLLTGCGKNFDRVDTLEGNPIFGQTQNKSYFQKDVEEFVRQQNKVEGKVYSDGNLPNMASTLMDKVPINLVSLANVSTEYKNEGFVGVCRKYPQVGKSEILFDNDYWQNNPNERTILVLHELGHCVVNRQHINPPSPCRSIMEPILLYPYVYEKDSDYLGYELFQRLDLFKSLIKNKSTLKYDPKCTP
jgi:hypothetical protein